MTRVSDLPKDLQDLLFWLGYFHKDEVIPTTVNRALGDEPHDGHVSFFVRPSVSKGTYHGRGQPGYFMIGSGSENSSIRDRISYFPPEANSMVPIISVPDISRWAEQIDPRSGSGKLASIQWPEAIAHAEAYEASEAKIALCQATGTPTDGTYRQSAAAEFSELPIGHPAKDFAEEILRRFGAEIQAVEQMPYEERTPQSAPAVYNKYFPILQAMKSVKVLYEAGEVIWDDSPHLHGRPIHLLYPGSGSHVGALAMAMALIDRGAEAVDALFTEIDGKAVDRGFEILFHWIRSNPDLQGDLKIREEAAMTSKGKRLFTDFAYKGKKIRLTFAWNDSPDDLYFHPADLERSDVVLIYDVADEAGETESQFLKQVLPLLNPGMPAKAIVMTNELDLHPFRRAENDTPWSVLPIRGRRIPGSFGHGGGFPVRNHSVGVTGWSMSEIGVSYHQSALIFSTGTPLIQSLKNQKDAELFVDFALVAGSRIYNKVPDPGSSRIFNFLIISGKEVTEADPRQLLLWCAQKIQNLPPEDQHYLALIAARLVIQWAHDQRYEKHGPSHRLIPDELAPHISRALAKEGLIPSEARSLLKRLDRFGAEELRRLDVVLLEKQTL